MEISHNIHRASASGSNVLVTWGINKTGTLMPLKRKAAINDD